MKVFMFAFAVFVLSFFSAVFADTPSPQLIAAIGQAESGGDDNAVGDTNLSHPAYGWLQIRQPCVDDVNRRYGTDYVAEDCLGNRELSVWICQRYVDMYATEKRIGRPPTEQDMARIWNGGPNGWKKPSTVPYWQKVLEHLPPD